MKACIVIALLVGINETDTATNAERLYVDPVTQTESAIAARAAEFSKSQYRFCSDENYTASFFRPDEEFCRLFDAESVALCPKIQRICEAETGWLKGFADWVDRLFRGSRSTDAPSTSGFLPWFLGAAALLGLIMLGRVYLRDRLGTQHFETLSHAEQTMQALPKAPARSLLDHANTLAQTGRGEEAAIHVHLALLRHADTRGISEFHPAKTNNEYLRSLRHHPELEEVFRATVQQTDQIRFGSGRADLEVVTDLLIKAADAIEKTRSSSASRLPIVTAVLLILPACGGLSGAPFHDASPSGMAALPALLKEGGIQVAIHNGALDQLDPETAVIVIPISTIALSATSYLEEAAQIAPWIIVLDDLEASQQIFPVSAVEGSRDDQPAAIHTEIDSSYTCENCILEGLQAPRLPQGRTFQLTTKTSSAGYKIAPFLSSVSTPEHRPALELTPLRHAGPETHNTLILLFARPALFSNASLTLSDNARFTLGVFAQAARGHSVAFVESLSPSKTAVDIMAGTNLLALFVHGWIILAGYMLLVGTPFSRLRDPPQNEHQTFARHVDALGQHWYAAGPPGIRHAALILSRALVKEYANEGRGPGGWQSVAERLAQHHDLEPNQVLQALELTLEGEDDQPVERTTLEALSRMTQTTKGKTDGPHELFNNV